MNFDLAAGKFQVGPTAQSAAAVNKARQMMQTFDVALVGEIRFYVNAMESSTFQGQVGPTEKPEEQDTDDDDDDCEPCSGASCDLTDGNLNFSTKSGTGGAGPAPSVQLQRNQRAATPQTGFSAMSAASAPPSPFGNGWSRTAAPSLTMRGTDPANPTSVAIQFTSSNTRVYQNIPNAAGQPAFYRATRQGSTDRFARRLPITTARPHSARPATWPA